MPSIQIPEWQNPEITGINKEPAHVTLLPYADEVSALHSYGDQATASPFFKLLNGNWKFHWSPNPASAPVEFYREDFDDRAWGVLAVPSNQEIQGYGQPRYLSASYAFDISQLPRVPEDNNPVGSYRLAFQLPPEWQVGPGLLNVSAHHFTTEELTLARHPYDLVRRPEITLNLDYAQSGLGSASCGPGRLEQYQLKAQETRFSLRLRPYSTADEDAMVLSKQVF